MYKITQNLDGLYYRNRATIENSKNCTPYKTIKTYTTCNEDQVEKTEVPTKTDFVKKDAPVTAPVVKPTVEKPVGI